MRKNIFVINQGGVKPEYVQAACEAVDEFMSMFPAYRSDYPVKKLGRWSSKNSSISHAEYMRVPAEKRGLYVPTSDGKYLVPYESTDWAMAIAKFSAISCGRPNQINASMLLDLMENDPTVRQIPQIDINLVKDDAFAMSGGRPNNFVYGLGQFDKGMVLSINRYEQQYGDNPEYMKEVVKTIVMHELGHIFGATFTGRHNTSNRDGYGDHCDCPDCIMRTDTKAKADRLTNDRLRRKIEGQPPLCPECVASVEFYMAKLRGNERDLMQAMNKFNRTRNNSIDY